MNDGTHIRARVEELEADGGAKAIAPDRKQLVPHTRQVELDILERMCDGETLLSITRDEAMPTFKTVRHWVNDDPEGFGREFEMAREVMLARIADETLEIADDGSNDWEERQYKNGSGTYIALNTEAVMRSKLRIDTRRWYLAMMSPKYREEQNINVKGAVAVAHITDRDRAKKIAMIVNRVQARERALEDQLAPAIEHDEEPIA